MVKLKKMLQRFPSWSFSVFTLLVILWLTLAPKPLGDEAPVLFPGADKIVHGIMFGFLVMMILLDIQRKTGWVKTGWVTMLIVAAISSFFGIMIEFAQLNMNMGRGFETSDMAADAIGAFSLGIVWELCQHLWIDPS